MKVLVAVISALALIGTYSGGAEARGTRVRLTVECHNNPERLTVANIGRLSLSIVGISTLGGGMEEETIRRVSDKLSPGESITYESGSAASGPNVLTRKFIFDRDPDPDGIDDGAMVVIVPKGAREEVFTHALWKEGTTVVRCKERSSDYWVSTETLELTLYGTVPPMQSFSTTRTFSGPTFYGSQEHYGIGAALCQDSKAEIPADKPGPACRGGGSVHSVTVPQVNRTPYKLLSIEWIRRSFADCTIPVWRDRDCTPQDQTFLTSKVGVDAQDTHRAWYDFDTGRGGAGEGPGGRMPGGMPTTGGGGMAGSDG